MKYYVKKITDIVKSKNIRYDIHSFDSGAFMIDLWIKNYFYCIQLFDNEFGLSKVDENTGFDTIPDETFIKWEIFEQELIKITDQ